jgi:hypothetical protein
MPWKYSQQAKIEKALADIRNAGLVAEATVLAQEITVLKAELHHLRNKT